MTIQSDFEAAKTALENAQAAFAAAQSKMDAATPHIALLGEVKAWAETLAEDAKAKALSFAASFEALLNI